MHHNNPTKEVIYLPLKSTDQAVLKYLDELSQQSEGETCTASIPRIASSCDISERQAQISIRRLIAAGLLERVGYDLGNPEREKRGTIYKVLAHTNHSKARTSIQPKKRSIKFLLIWSEE